MKPTKINELKLGIGLGMPSKVIVSLANLKITVT